MWLYGSRQSNEELYKDFPFLTVSQFSYLPKTFHWQKYPHFHPDEYEFGFIVGGHGYLYLPGAEYPIGPGSITLVPPGVAHLFASGEGESLEYYVIRVLQADDSAPVSRIRKLGCRVCSSRDSDSLISLLHVAADMGLQSGREINLPIHLLCLAAWDIAMQDLENDGKEITISVPEYAYDILCFLQEHIYEKITLEDLAERFHLSASHISRVFTRTYHISPINYLIMSRMRRARTYILEDGLDSAEIAKLLAYGDTYQFVTAFTKFFGCRPGEYYDYVKRTEE